MGVVLGFDIDGVLADFVTAFSRLLTDRTGKNVPEVADRWDWYKQAGVTQAEEIAAWDWIQAHPWWWYEVGSLPGADEVLRQIRNYSPTDLAAYFITYRPRSAKVWTETWLDERWVENPTVLMVSSKGAVASSLGITHLIDDRPEYCIDVYRASDETIDVTLLATSYNKSATEVWRTVWEQGQGINVVDTIGEWWERVTAGLKPHLTQEALNDLDAFLMARGGDQ